MIIWEYKVTHHVIDELKKCETLPTPSRVFSCSEAGPCIVSDVCKAGPDTLASVLNDLGKQGWELIMTNYHHGALLCIWKKPKVKKAPKKR